MIDKHAHQISALNDGVSDLQTRLAEVMTAMRWEHADLVRVSKQSSSVVSQWLGKGSKSKIIKSIGKMEAAENIERASGFAALWVAKGLGPKRITPPAPAVSLARSPIGTYSALEQTLADLAKLISEAPVEHRHAIASNLSGMALDGGASHWLLALLPLLTPAPEKQQRQR